MKVPLVYPKIPDGRDCPLKQCVAFEKLDGTNIHWLWQNGWKSFGTRRNTFNLNHRGVKEFNEEHPGLERSSELFNDKIRDTLTKYFACSDVYRNCEVIVFTEFWGQNSFAGTHSEEDKRCDTQHLTVIDISIGGEIISPQHLVAEFDCFGQFDVAKVIYKGKYSGQFVEDVRNGKYKVNEGVVCKGVVKGQVYMTKIKTNDYLNRLKNSFPNTWVDHWE